MSLPTPDSIPPHAGTLRAPLKAWPQITPMTQIEKMEQISAICGIRAICGCCPAHFRLWRIISAKFSPDSVHNTLR